MNVTIKIRPAILSNFKESNRKEIKQSIEESVNSEDEIILPGLGVFFELLWNKSTEEYRDKIIDTIAKNMNEYKSS